jgi:hypothetical protein
LVLLPSTSIANCGLAHLGYHHCKLDSWDVLASSSSSIY